MSGRGQSNTNSSRQRDTNASSETTTRKKPRHRWTYEQEKTLIELFDHAISMTNYTTKDPSAMSREYMVDKFNSAFNMRIKYVFFKNKLDEFKKAYKKWKELMNSTGISVYPETSEIFAYGEWWTAREGCPITAKFNRKPHPFWDVMQRCFSQLDVSSQPQHSSHQRREEIMNERYTDDVSHDYSYNDGDDMPENHVDETEEDEEVYRVHLDDDENPSNEFTRDSFQVPAGRGEQRS